MELTERVPYDATAQRPSWTDLPPAVRARVEHHLGAPVARAAVATGGFTRGFAALVRTSDGTECFVKAASRDTAPIARTSYAAEARVLAALPAAVPAPRLLWSDEADDWVLLGITPVPGHMPGLPWTPGDLGSAVDACEQAATALTPPPAGLPLTRLADDLVQADPATTYFARATAPDADLTLLNPWARAHLTELQRLCLLAPEAVDGESACHGDLRADNLIVDETGLTWVCDWNWLALAAPWTDLAGLLISVHADGLDADAAFRGSWLGRDVDADALDAWLAAIAEFMLSLADESPDFASSWIGPHRRFFGTSALSWLAHRRG